MKKSIYTITALLFAASTFIGCSLPGATPAAVVSETPMLLEPVDVPVSTTKVAYRDFAITSYYESTIIPYTEEYTFPIKGTISKQHVYIGDTVKAGDLLMEIDHSSIDRRLENLENRIESETKNVTDLNNKYQTEINKLLEKKATLPTSSKGEIAVIDCDIAIYETKIRQNEEALIKKLEPLQLELDELKESYGDYFLYAPMSGYVTYVTISDTYDLGTTVVAISDLTTKYLNTSYIDVSTIQAANRVYAIFGSETYDLRYIPYVYDSSSGRVVNPGASFSNFTLSNSNLSNDILEFGSTPLIVVENGFISNALTIPNAALNTDTNGAYVYLVSDSGARTRKDISIGNTNSIYTVVIDGLEEGDIVYVPN